MPIRLKRASSARLAVGLAVLAFPLLVTGVAQAAIAGASPASSTTQPNVRAATVIDKSHAEVCFDKAVTLGVVANNGFSLAGYRSGIKFNSTSAGVDPTNSQCVIATYTLLGPTLNVDINNYTVMTIAAGAVQANSGVGSAIRADSVTLTPNTAVGPANHDGTTGVSTAPNLVGILAPTGVNQLPAVNSLTFVFDRNTNVTIPNNFFFVNAAGGICTGAAVLDGNGTTTITVMMNLATFSTPGVACLGSGVGQAVRGGVFAGGATSAADPASVNYSQSVILPTCASPCATSRPDLVSAVLNPANLDEVLYTFDKPVVVSGFVSPFPGSGGPFQAQLSNGKTISGIPTGTGTSLVRVNFGTNLSKQAEYAVSAWANIGAVTAADNPLPSLTGLSTPGSANIGDNAGAFASGFTTAADVFGVTISHATGTVLVNVDQRVNAVNPAAFTLLTSTGAVVPATPAAPGVGTTTPGPQTFSLVYPASAITNATMLQINQAAMNTPLNNTSCQPGASPCFQAPLTLGPITTPPPNDYQNVAQIVTSPSGSAILKAARAYHAHHPSSKKHKHHRTK